VTYDVRPSCIIYAVCLRCGQRNRLSYLKWPSKVTQGHRNVQCHPLLDCLDILTETEKVSYTYFQTKLTKMILKIDEGHWRWHTSIGHTSLSISSMSIMYRLWDIQRRIMANPWDLGQGSFKLAVNSTIQSVIVIITLSSIFKIFHVEEYRHLKIKVRGANLCTICTSLNL